MVAFQKARLEESFEYLVETAESLAETKELLENGSGEFSVALLDINLPDAPEGEVVDYVLSKGIPAIVFTGSYDEQIRERITGKPIIDYIVKSNPNNFDHALRLISFIQNNIGTKVLIVDDSHTARAQMVNALEPFPLVLLEAKDGTQALEVLQNNRDIRMVITDQNMPKMDGVTLVQSIRQNASLDTVAVIGVSSLDDGNLTSVAFLKSGANDFIIKPLTKEVLIARIVSNMLMLDYIKEARSFASHDYLTGLYNRKYLHDTGRTVYIKAKQRKHPLSFCIIDIDHFKKVNDTYGHLAGDLTIQEVSRLIQHCFPKPHIAARYGGEEFCVLLQGVDESHAIPMLERLRDQVQKLLIKHDGNDFRITISGGVTDHLSDTFEQMIDLADRRLYLAKENGRNRVIGTDQEEDLF